MSSETLEWLNNNILVGYIDDREHWHKEGAGWTGMSDRDGSGLLKPWFAEEGYDGGYSGPVPIEAVRERLFNWDAVKASMTARVPTTAGSLDGFDGVNDEDGPYVEIDVPTRKAIVRNDTNEVLGVFSKSYKIHQYHEWLVNNVADLIDSEVQIDSAGLLKNGGVAWVSVSLPETVSTTSEFAVRPRLLCYTSHSGVFATTYSRGVGAPVCDNTLDFQIGRSSNKFKVKHSRHSIGRLVDAREVLQILHSDCDEMTEFFDKLADWSVTDQEFRNIVDRLEPVPSENVDLDGKVSNQKAITHSERRRSEIFNMYNHDARSSSWKGSALGALQAFNTWDQQVRSVRGGQRVESQMFSTLNGHVRKYNAEILNAISSATGQKEVVFA